MLVSDQRRMPCTLAAPCCPPGAAGRGCLHAAQLDASIDNGAGVPAAVARQVLLVLFPLPTGGLCLGCRSAGKGPAAHGLLLPTGCCLGCRCRKRSGCTSCDTLTWWPYVSVLHRIAPARPAAAAGAGHALQGAPAITLAPQSPCCVPKGGAGSGGQRCFPLGAPPGEPACCNMLAAPQGSRSPPAPPPSALLCRRGCAVWPCWRANHGERHGVPCSVPWCLLQARPAWLTRCRPPL